MSGYLESYAAIEERKAGSRLRVKRIAIVSVGAVIATLLLYGFFRNYHQEQQAKTFVRHLQNHEYQAAYRMWGCTEQTPCRDYAFTKFMEDWGPNSSHGTQSNVKIGLEQSCGDGVFLRLEYPKGDQVGLMIDRAADTVSFAPSDWLECPGRHWHFLDFFKRMFRS